VSTNIILCGDFNINHLDDSRKKHLESLLDSINLSSTVMFPTRICNNSYSLIDNIYTNTKWRNFLITPLINGLSDHDGQIIDLAYTRSVRKVSDRIFLCEHLMDYNLARLHEPTLNLSAHAW
jgi:hypothetical protein